MGTYASAPKRRPNYRIPQSHERQLAAGAKRLAKRRKQERDRERWGADNTEGLLYFIQGIDGGPIKIGLTATSLDKRLEAIQVGNPAELVVRRAIPVAVHRLPDVELRVHAHFHPEWIRGEWFRASPRLARLARAIPEGEVRSSSLQDRQIPGQMNVHQVLTLMAQEGK